MTFGSRDSALVECLRLIWDTAGVERVLVPSTPMNDEMLSRRILEEDVDQLLLPLGHTFETDRLRRFADAENHACVLHRKETLGHNDKKKTVATKVEMVTSSVMKR